MYSVSLRRQRSQRLSPREGPGDGQVSGTAGGAGGAGEAGEGGWSAEPRWGPRGGGARAARGWVDGEVGQVGQLRERDPRAAAGEPG